MKTLNIILGNLLLICSYLVLIILITKLGFSLFTNIIITNRDILLSILSGIIIILFKIEEVKH